jgi:hypothetical protein
VRRGGELFIERRPDLLGPLRGLVDVRAAADLAVQQTALDALVDASVRVFAVPTFQGFHEVARMVHALLERRKKFPSGGGVSAFRGSAGDPILLAFQAPHGGVQTLPGRIDVRGFSFRSHNFLRLPVCLRFAIACPDDTAGFGGVPSGSGERCMFRASTEEPASEWKEAHSPSGKGLRPTIMSRNPGR